MDMLKDIEVLDIENMKGFKLVIKKRNNYVLGRYIVPEQEVKNFIGGVNGNIQDKGKAINKRSI